MAEKKRQPCREDSLSRSEVDLALCPKYIVACPVPRPDTFVEQDGFHMFLLASDKDRSPYRRYLANHDSYATWVGDPIIDRLRALER